MYIHSPEHPFDPSYMPHVDLFGVVPFLRLVQLLDNIFALAKDLLALIQNVLRCGYSANRKPG